MGNWHSYGLEMIKIFVIVHISGWRGPVHSSGGPVSYDTQNRKYCPNTGFVQQL